MEKDSTNKGDTLFSDSLKSILEGSREQDFSLSIARAVDYEDLLIDFHEHGMPKGTTTHMHTLDANLRWRPGFFYLWTGWPGAGKSYVLMFFAILRAKREGVKTGIYAPENYPVEYLIEELMRMYLGKDVSKGWGATCSREEFDKALRFVDKHFFIVDFDKIARVNDVLEQFTHLYSREGCQNFIIDPFNSLVEGSEGSNISQYLKVALTQFKLFAAKHKVTLNIVEHPKTPAGVISADERPQPSPFLVYGGTMWWNKTDVIVTVDRNMFDSKDRNVEITVWKVKQQKLNGVPGTVTIHYNVATGQYEEKTFDEQMEGIPAPAKTLEEKINNMPDNSPTPF